HEAADVSDHDVGAPQRARHQAFQGSLAALPEEGDDGDDEHQQKDDQPDERTAEVVQGVETGPTVEVVEARFERRHPRSLRGSQAAGGTCHRLAEGQQHRLGESGLGALQMDRGSDHIAAQSACREIGWQDDVGGHRVDAQVARRLGLRGPGDADLAGLAEVGGEDRAQRAPVEVDHVDCGKAGAAAGQEVEEAEQDDRRAEEEHQGAPVVAELLEDAEADRAAAAPVHDLFSESTKKASSSRSAPASRRSSAEVPSASIRPKRMSPRRPQRSASSMTWLETMMVVPSPDIVVNRCHSSARSCGSTPTVGSSRSSRRGRWTSAQASETRWRIPPLSVATTERRRDVRSTSSSASTALWAPVRRSRSCTEAKKRTFSLTVRSA